LCQSDIDDSKKESLLSKYREDLEKMENELEKLYEEQEMCRKEIFRLERLLKDISSLKNKYGGLKEKERNLQNKLQELNKYSEELQDVNNKIFNLIDTLEKSIRVVEETLKTCMSKREEYRREIESLKYDSEDHNRIKKEVEEILNNLTSMVREIGEYNGRLKSRRRDLKNRLEELDKLKELEKEKEKLERFIKYLENIREKVFSKDGFQQYLRKRYTPLIQRYTNEIFSEFELPYHYIQIKEDYDILVDEFPVKNLSGGEQIAVSLALRLGIAKALCSSLQFIILDEPTAFLDEDRRKKLLDIFKSIKTISQIFIISHHQELEQIADSTIHVTKRGGISYVSQGIT
ncbi:MAG TPA: DNA repair protein Rad50, partial [Methanothermococcus okinawensis]|nr:DNA repair protein Rad50 [Methanothermococcus okinawensis]